MEEKQKDILEKVKIFGKRTSMTKRQFKVLCLCLAIAVTVAVVALLLAGYFCGWLGGQYGLHAYGSAYDVEAIAAERFSVHFLQTDGQSGDCIYIKAGETDVLIDAGPDERSAISISRYIDRFCTDGVLEYVVATHADVDHIGGFVGTKGIGGIFDRYEVRTIIQFAQSNSSSKVFYDYCQKRDAEIANGAVCFTALDCCKEIRGAKRVYELTDGVTMEVLYQKYYETHTETENDYSVCLLFTAGETRCLFTGDLEESGEASLVESNRLPEVTLYKAGHHGSETSSNLLLLSEIKPRYVCVCCVAGSAEYSQIEGTTFPAQSFIDRIALYTSNVYVTNAATVMLNEYGSYVDVAYRALNGDIVFACTDNKISMYFSESDKVLAQTDWFKQNRRVPLEWSDL